MSTFRTVRNRDARATIRGFLYQVDLTIERWLELDEDEVLELESGEDFDIINRALESDDESRGDRLLNQVKSSDSRLSLRSPVALGAIANFIEHRLNNPERRLLFRFITNAPVTCERPAVFDENTPAITIWMRLHFGELRGIEAAEARGKIRSFLSLQKRPARLSMATWGRLLSHLDSATDAEFAAIVDTFEWVTAQSSPEAMSKRIESQLVELRYSSSPESAHNLYSRLSLHVFKLLSTRGLRELTRASLKEQCALPEIPANVKIQLARLEALQDDLEQRVASHELALKEQAIALANLQEMGSGGVRLDTELTLSGMTPTIQVPPRVERGSCREQAVDNITAELSHNAWMAIYGPSGTGKTQLLILAVERLGRCKAWVRLSSKPAHSSLCLAALEHSLEVATHCPIGPDRRIWYDTICRRLEENAVVVIDDIPRLAANDPLTENIVLFCSACDQHSIDLLTTSPHPLPTTVLEKLGTVGVCSKQMPPLSDEETREILAARGAPTELLKSAMVSFLNTVCRQHPSLVAAAAQYLEKNGWRLAEKEFDYLLRSKYATEVNRETLDRLLQTVASAQGRELLERLALIPDRFGNEEVKVVADVLPRVERPFDQLSFLLGIWVQYDASNRYLLSPLAKSLDSPNLAQKVKQRVHLNLGNSLLERRVLNQVEMSNVLIHFASAGAWDKVGSLLLVALQTMFTQGIPSYDAGLLSVYTSIPLPTDINLGLRIYIRALQISLHARARRPFEFLLGDINSMIAAASDEDAPAVFAASINLTIALAELDPETSCENLNRSFTLLSTVSKDKKFTEILSSLPLGSLIWISALNISTSEQILKWMAAIRQMPSWLSERAESDELIEIGSISVADGIWLREAKKPEPTRSWPTVRSVLSDLSAAARELGLEPLWGCAVRSLIIVMAEYEESFDQAIALGEEALKTTADPRARFIIEECIGRQFEYNKQNREAQLWFKAALEEPTEGFPVQRLQSYIRASATLDAQQYTQAQEYLERALSIGMSNENVSRMELVKAAGELCILCGLREDLTAAFRALDIAEVNLISSKDQTLRWKGLFVIMGHVSGYFASIAVTGHPPERAPSGEPYFAPHRGLLLTYNESECSRLYDESKECAIFAQLAQFADAVGATDRVEHWAFVGIEAARVAKATMVIASISTQVVPLLLLQGRQADAIALAVESSAIVLAGQKLKEGGRPPEGLGFDVESILGPKPNDLWNEAEAHSMVLGLLPAVCELAIMQLDSPEQAAELAGDAISACRQLGQTASHKGLWQKAADILHKAFVERLEGRDLVDLSNALNDETYRWLRAVGYICASIQPDIPLSEVCRLHLMIMPPCYVQIRPVSRITYDRILVRWISTFWKRKFEEQRFRFVSPPLVAAELDSAQMTAEAGRAQAILRVVVTGLNVSVGKSAEDWLENAPK